MAKKKVRTERFTWNEDDIVITKKPEDSKEKLKDFLANKAQKTFKPPEAAKNNAQKVLDWREKYGDEVKGMTEVGWRRASQLASGKPISLGEVKEIAQFNRHRKNSKVAPEYKDKPWKDAGHVAWMGWGGTSGVDWAMRISKQNDNNST